MPIFKRFVEQNGEIEEMCKNEEEKEEKHE